MRTEIRNALLVLLLGLVIGLALAAEPQAPAPPKPAQPAPTQPPPAPPAPAEPTPPPPRLPIEQLTPPKSQLPSLPAGQASQVVPTSSEIDVRPAHAAADAWIAVVDAADYGLSWDLAAPGFQALIPRADWEKMVRAVRAPLGPLRTRKLRSASYSRDPAGAPAGEYVIIQYQTYYENRPFTVETVTPRREADGSWKIAGYFVK